MYKKLRFVRAVKMKMENVFTSRHRHSDFAAGYEITARIDKGNGGFYWFVTPDGWGGKLVDKHAVEVVK